MKRTTVFILLLVTQAACVAFVMVDILSTAFAILPNPLSWNLRELMEIGALLGLFLGLIFGAILVRSSLRDLHAAEGRLDRAAAAFEDLLEEKFVGWGLTRAERDVAVFAIKGMSVPEIAQLRKTSEGTVKAQTAAIYRKAGVSGRPQLLSLFIEDMMGSRKEAIAET
jgi:DNA-binding CsgD family transcriptional regulator